MWKERKPATFSPGDYPAVRVRRTVRVRRNRSRNVLDMMAERYRSSMRLSSTAAPISRRLPPTQRMTSESTLDDPGTGPRDDVPERTRSRMPHGLCGRSPWHMCGRWLLLVASSRLPVASGEKRFVVRVLGLLPVARCSLRVARSRENGTATSTMFRQCRNSNEREAAWLMAYAAVRIRRVKLQCPPTGRRSCKPVRHGACEEVLDGNPSAPNQELAIRRVFLVESLHARWRSAGGSALDFNCR